jgi:membrane-bound lytic murein transglycosylase MltF
MSLQTLPKTRSSLIALAVLLLAACSKDSPPPSADASNGSPASQSAESAPTEAPVVEIPDTQAAAATLAKWTGDLDGMVERRVIRVLTTYSKTTFFIDQGTPRGLVPDSFKMFEDDLNKRLKNKHLRVQIVYVPVAHDDLIPALLEGRGDIISAGKVMTAWRAEQVDFTNPTRSGISTIVVTGPGVPPVNTVEDLGGKEVYLRSSDVSKGAIERFNAQLKAAGKAPVRIRPAPEVLADEDLIEMVSAGLVPITLVDDYIAEFWQQVFPNVVLNKRAAVRTDVQTAMMVRKGSPQLLAELNAFLARYPEGSLQRNVLLQKYLKSLKYANPATSAKDVARFRQVVDLMRKYGEQYDMDYLLMAAQGYQESGLDHERRSAVGAVGVMQVMPKTGAEQNVGDIKQLEPNIHAGIKYMRYMIDHYYANEPMDDLNKGLFAFASYNAGPARIRQLRKKAADRGLDPNKWFNNVEVVAAESIGRETVQYVSNIYKYYLAYQMVIEQQEQRAKAKVA